MIFIELLNEVRRLAGEQPARETKCMYWNHATDAPECLIGNALHNLGVTIPTHWNEAFVDNVDWSTVGFTSVYGPQLQWLNIVQNNTDHSIPWSHAVERADNALGWAA